MCTLHVVAALLLAVATADGSQRLELVRPSRKEAALDPSRVVTRLAFGSCNKHNKDQSYWRAIRARKPDVFVWLGDIVYADSPVFLKWRIPAEAATLKAYYEAQLANADYGALLAEVPVVGVYDDHDQGTNDADKYAYASDPVMKALSPQLFLDFIGEPPDSPRRAQPGVYAHYVLGTAPRRVHLVLLDVRTNRDPYFMGDAQDFLGDTQWAWLEGVLRDTDAEVTIIGSGLQVLSRGDPWIAEMWYKLPQSQAKLLALVAATRVRGAVFLSGDVHFGELNEMRCPAVGYPLYDVTSSGLTHSWGGLVKRTTVDACLVGDRRVPGTAFYSGTNWGEVEIAWGGAAADDDASADGAAAEAPTTLTLRVWGIEDGAVHIEHSVPLAALRPAVAPSAPTAPDPWRADAEACARDALSAGLSRACAAFIASCGPALPAWRSARYYAGHVVVIGAMGVVALLAVTAPCLAWVLGPRLPGKRPLAFAVVAMVYAAGAVFVDSIH